MLRNVNRYEESIQTYQKIKLRVNNTEKDFGSLLLTSVTEHTKLTKTKVYQQEMNKELFLAYTLTTLFGLNDGIISYYFFSFFHLNDLVEKEVTIDTAATTYSWPTQC
uniref:Uncharacterized protein n=1 Tax=Glossina brevipalpis TaxID=37001 RepID=A0A1A9WFG4_9MUSC